MKIGEIVEVGDRKVTTTPRREAKPAPTPARVREKEKA
jgi:hypothetical protein